MKKKLITIFSTLLAIAMLASLLVACDGTKGIFATLVTGEAPSDKGEEEEKEERFGADELYSDNGYIDYASEVYYDMDANPDLVNQGMFWCYWDESSQTMVQVPAATAEGAALVDSSKPTLVCIHGMLVDGAIYQENYDLKSWYYPLEQSRFSYSDSQYRLNMIEFWIRNGWNVAMFNYNRFATEFPASIEEKVWDAKGEVGMTYMNSQSERIDSGSEYCIAEHFAAEYIRAMKLLPKSLGDQEIRFLCHSMGGPVTAAGTFLLTELAKVGQIDECYLPTRLAFLDSYFSVYIENNGKVFDMGPKNLTINWSGKPLVNGTTGDSIISAMEILAHYGMTIEYYSYTGSYLNGSMSRDILARLKKISAYTMMLPDYQENYSGFNFAVSAHDGVREYYMCSIFDETAVDDNGNIAPSANTSTEDLKKLVGHEYKIITGGKTLTLADDIYQKIA